MERPRHPKAVALRAAAPKTANVDPVHSRVIEEFRATKKMQTLGEYYASWSERAKRLEAADDDERPPPRLDPSELGCTLGPFMTEAQFREYRKGAVPSAASVYTEYHARRKTFSAPKESPE